MRTLVTAFVFSVLLQAQNSVSRTMEARQGSAAFEVATNMPGIAVHGKSKDLQASAQLRHEAQQLVIDSIEARLDTQSLSTDLELRDQHMREKIFAAGGGSVPELRFAARQATCPLDKSGKETTCEVQGTFFVRGVGKPMRFMLKIKPEEKDGGAFRVSGDGSLKLSDYGIERPSQLGVRVADEVRIRVEFVAKERGKVS